MGGVAGGASVAARVRRLDENAEIVMFERGPHVSFSNCSLPFYLSKRIPEADDLVLISPEKFEHSYNIDAKVNSEVVKRVDVAAAMITMNATIYDLKDLELCYSPMFSSAKDPLNHAALVGINILNGDFKQIKESEVRALVEEGALIMDVREKAEYERGHVKGSKNIPMSEFSNRLNEIPKDQPVYVHCRSGQRSYNVCKALGHLGYEHVHNISGSFLGISYFEYYMDQQHKRNPIVTAYNFN